MPTPRRNFDPYWDDIEGLMKQGRGPKLILRFLQAKYDVTFGRETLKRELKRRGIKTPTLETYKKEILEWLVEGVERKEMSERIFKVCDYRFTRAGIKKAIDRWHREEETGTTKTKTSDFKGIKVALHPYKNDLVGWEEDGFSVDEMVKLFREKFGFGTLAKFVKDHLDFWKQTWRGIEEGQGRSLLPMDQRTDEDLGTFELLLQSAYEESRPPPDSELDLPQWSNLLVKAACYDRGIQGLIVKEYHQPGHHWSESRRFNHLWVAGIRLPGSYHYREAGRHDKIMGIVEKITPNVLARVRIVLDSYLQDGIRAAVSEYGEEWLQAAKAMTLATTPPMCIARLLRIARSDLDLAQGEAKLKASCARVAGPACQALYEAMGERTADTSTAETYTDIALEEVKSWQTPGMTMGMLPAVTDRELEMVEESVTDPSGYEGESEEVSDSEDADSEAEREFEASVSSGLDSDGSSDSGWESDFEEHLAGLEDGEPSSYGARRPRHAGYDRADEARKANNRQGQEGFTHGDRWLLLYKTLRKRVTQNIKQPIVFCEWMTPTTGALLGTPPARFGFEPWEPDRQSFMMPIARAGSVGVTKLEPRARSIIDAQKFFRAEADAAPQLPDRQRILDDAIKYTKKIITERTSDEKVSYEAICRRMSACTSRAAEVGDLSFFPKFSRIARDDDWFHTRRLLQMLAVRYSLLEQTYHDLEIQLMMLLAAIEGGSTEAVLWFIPLELVLVDISQRVKNSSFISELSGQQEQRLQNNLLTALVTFTHSVAINNLTFRCHYEWRNRRRPDAPESQPLTKWYTALHNTDPRCARSSCMRLLPHPGTVKILQMLKSISVGTRDPRRGSAKTRAFISGRSRQGPIYGCLVTWLVAYEANPALICIFFFSGGIYHRDASCKFLRGKWSQNF